MPYSIDLRLTEHSISEPSSLITTVVPHQSRLGWSTLSYLKNSSGPSDRCPLNVDPSRRLRRIAIEYQYQRRSLIKPQLISIKIQVVILSMLVACCKPRKLSLERFCHLQTLESKAVAKYSRLSLSVLGICHLIMSSSRHQVTSISDSFRFCIAEDSFPRVSTFLEENMPNGYEI